MLFPCLEPWEITKYHLQPSFMLPYDLSQRRPYFRARRGQPSSTACLRGFQVIRQGPGLPRSFYAASEVGVDPSSQRRHGHRHIGQRLIRKRYCDAPINLPRGLRQRGVPYDLPSVEPTPEPGPPSETPTKEMTLEHDSDALSEPSTPTREGYMGHLSPKYIVVYQKGSDPPRFATIEELTKESPCWGHLENPDFEPRQEPGGSRRPPNSD